MSFPAYPKYKDSGVEWLGQVPEHWGMVRLRYITECLDGKRIPLNSSERADKQGAIPYWGANCIVDYVDESLFDEELVLLGEDGAPFFDSTKPVAFLSNGPIWPNNHVHVLRTKTTCFASFLVNVLNTTDYSQFIDGSTRDKLTQGQMGSIPLLLPPLAEQRAIASFLDRETSKIDALVAAQRKLIALLKEKRQAVISHAVTKGLNPDAPMKDSGIEWLGMVPEHWRVITVRRLISRIEQGRSPQCDAGPAGDNEWGVLKTGCVNRGKFNSSENKALPDQSEVHPEFEVKRGDVLMSRASGSLDLVGATAFVYETRSRLMLSDKTFRILLVENTDAEYFVAVFNSRPMRAQIEQSISGAEGLANNLPQAKLRDFALCVPPVKEQRMIAADIMRRLLEIDALTAEAGRAVDLLQERRTALISAAVTGKIDVRCQGEPSPSNRMSYETQLS